MIQIIIYFASTLKKYLRNSKIKHSKKATYKIAKSTTRAK